MEYLTYLFKFEAFIERLELNLRKPKQLSVVWRKGKKAVETEQYSGYARGVMVIQESLNLSLKLYKEPNSHQYQPKFSTFSVVEHENQRRRVIMQAKFNLLQMLAAPSKEFTLVFAHGEIPGRLVFRGRHQQIMELNQFRFNTQQLQESGGEQNEEREPSEQAAGQGFGEEEVITLRKEIEDLNYMNGKLKNDREKLLLRIREVEFEFKEKEKLVLREIRHAKTYFEKKIKIRENVYEEEIQKLVSEANQEQATFARVQEQLREEIREIRARLSKTQTDLLESREEGSKLKYELQERVQQLKMAAIEKAQQEKRVNQVIENMQNEIAKCQGELRSMVGHLTSEKETVKQEFGSKLQELSHNLTSEIEKKLKDIAEKDRKLVELTKSNADKDSTISKLNETIRSIESVFNSNKLQLTKVEMSMEDTTSKVQLLMTDKRELEENLKSVEEELLRFKASHRQTKSQLEEAESNIFSLKEELHKQIDSAEQRESELHTDIDQLRQALEEKHHQIYEIKQRQRTLEGEKESLELDLRNANELRKLDADRINRVELQNVELRRQFDLKEEEMEARQAEFERNQDDMAGLRNDLHLMEMNKEDALNEVEKIKKAMKHAEQLYQRKIEMLQSELRGLEEGAKRDQRDATIEALYEQIKTKEADILKLNKKVKELSEAVNILNLKELNTSIDREIMAEIAHITSRDQSDQEEFSSELIETLKKEILSLRKQNHFLKRDVDGKDKLIKQYKETHGEMQESMFKVEEMKQSLEAMRSEGLEQMKQTLVEKEKQVAKKEKELAALKMEAQERIDELETQVQKYMLEIDEKDAKIRVLNKKLGNAPNAEVDKLSNQSAPAEPSNLKLKEVIKQLNKDHEAERQDLLKEISNLEATIEEMRRSSTGTPVKPRSSHGSAKDNFSFMPEGKLGSPKAGNDLEQRDRIKELERKLMAAEAEKNRLMSMVEDMEKHVSIIRENTNEQEHSEDSIQMMLKGEKGDDGRRRKMVPGKSPKSATPPMHLNTVESQRIFRQKDALELADLQNQLGRMRATHDQEIMRLNRQLSERDATIKEIQIQITSYKEKEIESRFVEREMKMKDQAIQSEKEKRKELQAKITEEITSRNRQIEKLEEQVRSFNAEYSNHVREVEKFRIAIESKERELSEARKARQDTAREFKEYKDNQKRELKKQYQQPAEVRLRELSKQLTKLRQTEYELKNQLERANDERKEKYVKLSEHKELKSELDRQLKDRSVECESLQRQLTEANQYRTKAQYTIRTLEAEIEEAKRRAIKLHDQHKSSIEDKDVDVRTMKKKLSSLERQQEQYESKVSQLQERQKLLNSEHEKVLDELNKKIMQQLREALLTKEQNEILSDEVKGWKKRHSEVSKIHTDIEDRLNLQLRQSDELKRANQKLHKELDEKQQHLTRSQQESRKNADEIRRQVGLKEDVQREKREAQQQIQKLDKLVAAQELEVKRLTREMDKVRSKVAETEEDQFSTTKSVKLQMQKQEELRRKLEKTLEEKDREIAAMVHRLHKSEEDKKDEVDSLNELYTDKLSLYVNQIDSIKKTIREYEEEIAYLKVQNRDLGQELEKAHLRMNHLETELKICSESLDSRIDELNFKREESDRVKQEKYQLELIHGKLSTEINILTEDGRKLVEKLAKMSELNRAQTDENQKLEMQIRVLKNAQQKLQYEVGQLRPYPDRCREFESMVKKLEIEREDLIEDIKHKNELIYSQVDFERFQEQLKASIVKEKELEIEQVLHQYREDVEQQSRKLEIELVEQMNESSRLKTDLERAKEHNAAILAQNTRMIEFERQSNELGKKVTELELLLKQREKQAVQHRANYEKSLKDVNVTMVTLEKELHIAKVERAEIEKELLRGRKSQEDQAESLKRTEEKGMEVLQKLNEDMRNKLMQIEFENARLRENEIALQGAYEKRLGDIQRREEQKIKVIEMGYAESLHRYESETERLKGMVEDLKYVIEDKNNEINYRRDEIEYLEAELNKTTDELKRTKVKINEEKQVYSLELFKIGSRMKENDDQWGLKVKRLEDELSRVTNQLVQTSSRVERELTYSKLRINDPQDKQARKIEQKLKLKEKTIEQLKEQILTLEQKLFKSEQDQLNRVPDSSSLVASLRTENDKLRDELRELTSSARDSSVVHKLEMEVASLTEASGNYKKEMMRSKKAEQDLQEKIDSITLQLESSSSEVTFLRGYESSYKQLKIQYERINQELRAVNAEGHINCQIQRDIVEKEKQELQEVVKDLQQKVGQLTSEKMTRDLIPKKHEQKEDGETAARIRQSLNQYREQLNKREAILNREMDMLKERNSGLLEKLKKVQFERDEASRKLSFQTQHMAELNEQNIRYSEEIFRLNSNIMKEQFTLQDVREGLQARWETMSNTVLAAVNLRLEEGITYLIESHQQRLNMQEEFRHQRDDYERKLYQLAEQIADLQQRLQIREQQFKFERERDSLDIQQLTKETEKLQQRINDLEQEVQGHHNLEIEFERLEYEYNNCKILLDVCRAELEQLRSTLQIENQTFLPKEQIVEDLQDILSKVHQH